MTDVDPPLPSYLDHVCSEQEGGRDSLTFSFSGIQYTVGKFPNTRGNGGVLVLKLLQEGNFLVVQWLGLALLLARPWFNPCRN